jgi:hypothetical protein
LANKPGVGPVVGHDVIFEENRYTPFKIKSYPAFGITLGVENIF